MQLRVAAIGHLKAGPEREIASRYAGRIKQIASSSGFSFGDPQECPESRARRPEDRKAEEAGALLARRSAGGALILLDERGAALTSPDFAALLARLRDAGRRETMFFIGGADGLDPSLRGQAEKILSFGAMTMPHQLARILLLEQIYRAMTILTGHPYHRA